MCTHIIIFTCTQKKGVEKGLRTKMGRPTDNPKTEQIKIRATKEEVNLLKECCDTLGKTQREVIIQGIELVHEAIKK